MSYPLRQLVPRAFRLQSEPDRAGTLDLGVVKRLAEVGIAASSLGIVGFLLFSSALQLGLAGDNLSLIGVVSADESLAISRLVKNIEHHDLDPRGFYSYGYLHLTLSYALLSIFRYLHYDVTSTKLIVFVTRGVSWIAYGALLLIFERSLRALRLERTTRLAFVAFLGGTLTLWRWGHTTHPDVLQALLAFCVLWILLPDLTLPRVLLASVVAGLSFGTKASGVFSLGLVVIAYAADRLWFERDRAPAKQILPVAGVTLGALGCFVVGWLGSNPYVAFNFAHFVDDLMHSQHNLQYGRGYKAPWHPADWFVRLGHQFGSLGSIVLAIGIALLLLPRTRDPQHSSQPRHLPALLVAVAVYLLAAGGQLLLQVDNHQDRYLMHILPFVVWLAAAGWALVPAAGLRLPALALPALVLLAAVSMARVSVASRADNLDLTRNPNIRAGQWIASKYPASTRIIAERYSYIPDDFVHAIRLSGSVDAHAMKHRKPQLLVINKRQSGRYFWKRPKTHFSELRWVTGLDVQAAKHIAFYRRLFAAESKWDVVYEQGEVVVLERKP